MISSQSNASPQSNQTRPLLLNKPTRPDLFFACLLISLFLASRLLNLGVLPVFTDEGMHIGRAQHMLETRDLIRGTLAGKFLHIWLLALIVPWSQNLLVAARALSVATGLACGIATIYLAYTLWPDRKVAWITALIYLPLPFPLMNERMALSDSLLTVLTTLTLALSIKLIRHRRAVAGYALGVCLGLAYLTKLNGLIYFAIPIAALILLGEETQSPKILIRPYVLAFLIALPTVLEFPSQFLSVAVRSVLNPIGPQMSAGDWRLYGLGETWLDLGAYVTWPVLLLAAMHILHGLRTGKRDVILLAILLLMTPVFYIVTAKDVWYSRYLLPMVPLLVVLAARTLVNLASLLARSTRLGYERIWLAALCLLTLLPSLFFDCRLITDPRQAPLSPVDRWQYITGWPAGYGLAEAASWLRQEATKDTPIVVITDIHHGPTQEGVRLYLDEGQSDSRLLSVDLRRNPDEALTQLVQAQTFPTLLLLNEPADKSWDTPESPCPTVLAVFPKPENHSRLVLKSCSASSP
jgi:4-amino-4-deoxy-L-arabinose transferase-like glycosyltransferase